MVTSEITLSVSAHIPWWFIAYIKAVKYVALITGLEPDVDVLCAQAIKVIKIKCEFAE